MTKQTIQLDYITTNIQEARVFNDSPISPRKCRALLTRIVYLLYIWETFNAQEATMLFFGTTKLFQHKDMVYLAIKELATTAEDAIMVICRPNVIRALRRIIDVRLGCFFKAAIVNQTPSVSSAMLVSSYHLFPLAKDVVKCWSPPHPSLPSPSVGGYLNFGSSRNLNRGYQPIPSTSYIPQYHALGLLYSIRQQDRMAVTNNTAACALAPHYPSRAHGSPPTSTRASTTHSKKN
ncbi:hypothetical protein EDD22DRAFT_978692 [Suillus occidentalis]|nr:hypothetical protein EDD22DRAFT_978692 [Suillus occidentalis]